MIDMLLMTIVWPAVAGLGVLLVSVALQWWIAGWPRDDRLPAADDASASTGTRPLVMAAGAVAAALAFAISYRYTEGQWTLSPHERWQWVFHMAMAGGAIGVVNALIPGRWLPTPLRMAAVAAGLALIGALLLRPLPPMHADAVGWPDWLWKTLFGGFVLMLWLGMEATARRAHGGWTMVLAVIAALTAASLVIIESRFAKLAQVAGAMAATCGLVLVVAIALAATGRRLPVHSGMTAPLAMILPGLLVFGWFYNAGDVPTASFLLTAIGPLALLLTLLPPMRGWTGWRSWLLRIALALILPAIAVVMTMIREVPPEPTGYEW